MTEKENKDGKGKKLTFTIKYEIEETSDGADVNFKLQNSEEDRLFAYMVSLWDLSMLLDKAMTDDNISMEMKADFLTAAKILKDMTQACKMKVEEKHKIGEQVPFLEKLKKLFKDASNDVDDNSELKAKIDSGAKPSKVILGGDIPEELREQLENALREQFGEDIPIGSMTEKETKDFIDKQKSKEKKGKEGEVDFDDLNTPSGDNSEDLEM